VAHRKSYRHPRVPLKARWELAPTAARACRHAGNQRLHRRWVHFTQRKKDPVVANVAIARELARWCWSLAVMDG
jgi:transposase